MNLAGLRRVAALLRQGEEKVAGVIAETAKAIDRGAVSASQALQQAGHPLAAGAARLAPYAAGAWGAKKVYESEPVQRVKAKIDEIRYRRALRQQGMI